MTDHDQVERLKAQLENLSESHLGQRVLIAAMGEERDGMVKMVEQATTEIERLRDQVVRLTAERDEARRLLKSVVNMMRENMAPDATHPQHTCDFIHRPDIAMCKVCEDWTDAMVLCYPDEFQDKEDGK